MDREVKQFVRLCRFCAASDKSRVTVPSPLSSVLLPDKALAKLTLDIIGPLNVISRDNYGIIGSDYFSRWSGVFFERCDGECIFP